MVVRRGPRARTSGTLGSNPEPGQTGGRVRAPLGHGGVLRWASALRGANHPTVVAIVDVVEQGARQYVVTELLRGRTLAELIKDGALPRPRALHIAWQAAQARAAADQLGGGAGGVQPGSGFRPTQ